MKNRVVSVAAALAAGVTLSVMSPSLALAEEVPTTTTPPTVTWEELTPEQQAALSADRRAQVGTGERAEKIRTYNYGERRVTDHRIKLTQHNLEQVLEGELDEFSSALQADEKRRKLEAQAAAA